MSLQESECSGILYKNVTPGEATQYEPSSNFQFQAGVACLVLRIYYRFQGCLEHTVYLIDYKKENTVCLLKTGSWIVFYSNSPAGNVVLSLISTVTLHSMKKHVPKIKRQYIDIFVK